MVTSKNLMHTAKKFSLSLMAKNVISWVTLMLNCLICPVMMKVTLKTQSFLQGSPLPFQPLHMKCHTVKKTCIDNIHTNDIDPTIISGVLHCCISYHHPVFVLKELPDPIDPKLVEQEKVTIHYNYSTANLDKLCKEIEQYIDQFHNECDTFDAFLCLFQDKIDASCKLETPKTTKRNSVVNPRISPY